ncbi:LLM class flavin-dependent oxidoreductase [Nocardia paucivorans]|uniref:LLM class flavin-dependent oxidoreductase n=1 Tax=Nocardia paucivorans TaxID=114259 RepID=UPI00030A64B9|nr:LLM class flavin-dependent oxidoreductase [Nocardia paucivorans]
MVKSIADGKGFKLGLFSANCSSGLAVTKIPERWSGSWEDNLRLAELADEVGLDFLLPIARWIGYGGETNFHEGVLDPTALAAGLLAHTRRISVFATIHTAFNHPVVVAKQMATVDHIGQGRAGINIVAGWNQPEYEAMGVDLPTDHDDRYELAQEWWDVIRKIWTTPGRFDHKGRFYQLTQVEGMPKPYDGVLPVLNAGSSGQGRDYAARNADFAFTIVGGPEDGGRIAREVREQARQRYNRSMGVFTLGHVVCRPTRAEAEEYLHYYADENADWDAVDNLMRLQGMHAKSFTPEMLQTFRARFAAGHGSCPLIGTPDEVADRIEQFYQAGFGGMTLSFVDYVSELEYFAQEVLPRLEARGVRVPR